MTFFRSSSACVPVLILALGLPAAADAVDLEPLRGHYTDTMNRSGETIRGTGRIGGIAVDGWGYAYVANFDLGVWRVSPSGEVVLFADGLYGASGNTVLPNGDLLQANFAGDSIVRIDRTGKIHPFADSGLNGPVGLTRNTDGHIYVANYMGHSISRITLDGKVSEFARHDMIKGPNSIVADPEGNLYVVSMQSPSLVKITPEGTVSEIARLPGNDNAHLALLNDVFYVTKIWDHVVLRVSMDGEFKVISGTGVKGLADGPEGQASLAYPNGIASRGGVLYVNTLDGDMVSGETATINVRRIYPPNLRDALLRTFDSGGGKGLMDVYAAIRKEMATFDPIASGIYSTVNRLARTGHEDVAFRLLDRAVEDDDNKLRAHRSAGDLHAQFGDREKAIHHIEAVLALEPDDDVAQRRLEGVRAFRLH